MRLAICLLFYLVFCGGAFSQSNLISLDDIEYQLSLIAKRQDIRQQALEFVQERDSVVNALRLELSELPESLIENGLIEEINRKVNSQLGVIYSTEIEVNLLRKQNSDLQLDINAIHDLILEANTEINGMTAKNEIDTISSIVSGVDVTDPLNSYFFNSEINEIYEEFPDGSYYLELESSLTNGDFWFESILPQLSFIRKAEFVNITYNDGTIVPSLYNLVHSDVINNGRKTWVMELNLFDAGQNQRLFYDRDANINLPIFVIDNEVVIALSERQICELIHLKDSDGFNYMAIDRVANNFTETSGQCVHTYSRRGLYFSDYEYDSFRRWFFKLKYR